MDRKRSLGILLTAIYAIIIAGWIILMRGNFNFTYLLPNEFIRQHTGFLLYFGLAYTIAMPLSLLVGAIGLFSLKTWGRKLVLVCFWTDVFVQLLGIAMSGFSRKFMNPQQLVMQSYLLAVAEVLLIFYLTRLNVKKQFITEKT